MIIQRFVLTAFQQNTRVVACETTRMAICIDPGERSDELVDFLNTSELELQAITLTHGHLDHVGGTTALHQSFPDAEIILHAGDEDLYYGLPQQPLFMGVQPNQLAALGLDFEAPPRLSRNWNDGETYEVGELRFKVLHCPGHTRGHVVLAEETEKAVFVGDCLFAGSIGRTDLPGGDYEQLMDSILNKIIALGDDFTVYSGHGPETTTGDELISNPFLNGTYQLGKGKYI
jgi:glyoxylase-like metal-dependent hydrolase (beta-lactamase superfamily II)